MTFLLFDIRQILMVLLLTVAVVKSDSIKVKELVKC